MKSTKITTCLIGGAGFIGSHLAKVLQDQGKEVVVIDTMPAPKNPAVKYVQGDYGDRTFLQKQLRGIDEVVLLAYATVPKTSFEDPLSDMTSNLPPAITFFEASKAQNVRKIIIVSSGGTVYGKAVTIPIDEQHRTHPISPYGITKLAIEKYAGMYHHLYHLPIVTVRPSNAYGPGQRPFTGQGFISTAMACMIRNEPITIYGPDVVRDYVFVQDLVGGIASVLTKGEPGDTYNIGSGQGRSNAEMIKSIQSVTHTKNPRVVVKPARPFDVSTNVLDSSKLQHISGWQAKTTLDIGLQQTYAWLTSNLP